MYHQDRDQPLERGHLSPSVETLARVLLCLGYRLELGVAPLTPRTDVSLLEAVAPLTPSARLDHGLSSLGSLSGLLGAARGR